MKNNIARLLLCIGMVMTMSLVKPAAKTGQKTKKDPKETQKMAEAFEKAKKDMHRVGQLAGLTQNVMSSLPKGPVKEIAQPALGIVVNVANIGENIITKLGGGDKDFEMVSKRAECLLNYDDKALTGNAEIAKKEESKDNGCAAIGCVDTDTCFALTMHDIIKQLDPLFAEVVGRQVVDSSGKLTEDIETGLFMNLATLMISITDILAPKEKTQNIDAKTTALKNKLAQMGSKPLESIRKLAEDAQKVFIFMAKAFQPLPAAFTMAAGIMSEKALDYLEIPAIQKNTIKASAGSDKDEFDFGASVFDSRTVEKDFSGFGDL